MSSLIPYHRLVRWLRETHVKVQEERLVLPLFQGLQEQWTIFFERISATGFHRIREVRVAGRQLDEDVVEKSLEKEANFRVQAYATLTKQDLQFSPQTEYGLTRQISRRICVCTESWLIEKKLFEISQLCNTLVEEQACLAQLREKVLARKTWLANLWSSSPFLPGVSHFFPGLDGIGRTDLHEVNLASHYPIPGRIWLRNPLINSLSSPSTSSLYFFSSLNLPEDWQARDATLEDAALIHRWMNEPILARTFHQNYGLTQWKTELKALLESPFTRVMILSHRNQPAAYLELYRPSEARISYSLPFSSSEIGFHFGIAQGHLLGKGEGAKLIHAITQELLLKGKEKVSAVLADPDINNLAMFRACYKAGLRHRCSVALPHKCAYIVSIEKSDN
ncbi:MAG: GNAT family N-acetyltransferase [Neisseriaceae bacterium]